MGFYNTDLLILFAWREWFMGELGTANYICKWKADISCASLIQPPEVGMQYASTVQPKAGRSEKVYYFAK